MIKNYNSETALIEVLLEGLGLSNETLAVLSSSAIVEGGALIQLNKLIKSNEALILLGKKQLKEICL